jgi:hypothetical protein
VNLLNIIKQAELKKRKLSEAQLVLTKRSLCPVK